MSAAAQAVPQGKTIAGPDGKRIFFPAGTSDDDIAAAFGGGPAAKPSLAAPTSPPAPPQKSWLQNEQDEFDASTKTDPNEPLWKTAVRRTIGAVESPIVHPLNTLKGLVDLPIESGRDLGTAIRGEAPAQGPVQSRIDEAQSDYQQGGLPYAATKGAADIGGGIIGGKMLGELAAPAADAAATGLNAGGRLLKGAGAATSRLAVGAPAAADAMGADAGAGLARNRIVGLTRRSLQRKVAATVGPASEARDTILQRSDAAPVDVQPLTQAPFDDISEVKTDPQTGAVQPGAMRRLNVTRKAIQQVQDPTSGAITETPKDLSLTPAQMGKLQTNVYDMTDYQSPESTLSNHYTKSVGARLKGAINQAAPEAETATDNIHDLLGAQEHLKATTGAPPAATDLGLGKMAGHLYDAARTGGGTAAGAGLDLAGTGMMKAGGVLRRAIASSPVAPAPQTPSVAGPQRALPVPEAPGLGPEDLDRGSFPQRPSVTTPAPAPTLGLPASASPDAAPSPVAPAPANTHPGTPGPGARTRVQPSLLRPTSQQVLEDQPGFVSPRGTRPLIAGPDGRVTPQPYPLPAPPAQPLLESATGRAAPSARPALLRQFRNQAGTAAVADTMDREGAVQAGREKLAATPEGLPEQAVVEPPIARPKLNMDPSKVLPFDFSTTEPTRLYHGSPENLSSGTEPRTPEMVNANPRTRLTADNYKGTYLTPNPATAKVYGDVHAVDLPKRSILRIDPLDRASFVHPDPIPASSVSKLEGKAVPTDMPKGIIPREDPMAYHEFLYGKPKGKTPITKPAASPIRLPDPTDIDGWERLVDEGKAQYNVHTHQYEYTGPITRRPLIAPKENK